MKKFLLLVVSLLAGLLILGGAVVQAKTSQPWIQPPVVFTSITPRTSKIKVYVDWESTLYVKKGKRTLFKKYYENEGIKTITIPKQKINTKLKFYVRGTRYDKEYTCKKVTSKKTTIRVVQKAAKKEVLRSPSLEFYKKNARINIRGKIGTTVYVRRIINDKKQEWVCYGVILKKRGITRSLDNMRPAKTYTAYFQVRLKDIDGKYSRIADLDLKYASTADVIGVTEVITDCE